MIWEGEEVKKVDLTVLDISWTIIHKVDDIPETCDYIVVGIIFSIIGMLLPLTFRIYHNKDDLDSHLTCFSVNDLMTASNIIFGHRWR